MHGKVQTTESLNIKQLYCLVGSSELFGGWRNSIERSVNGLKTLGVSELRARALYALVAICSMLSTLAGKLCGYESNTFAYKYCADFLVVC